ncbi:MAG TPA: glycosyltransferase family 1 protein [Blastocatellia bacterium]|nr:glycosyltransferase family 1 protein [Blastocatellia bacterium]
MRIGIDVTPLAVGKGGVPKYTWELVRHLLAHGHNHEYHLVNVSRLPSPSLQDLGGPPRVHFLSKGSWGLVFLLSRKLPLPLQAVTRWMETLLTGTSLESHLRGLDLFHSSDVLQWDARPGRNIITMFDITTVLFPQFHTPANIRIHQRKIAFARDIADTIIAISHSTKNDLVNHCGIPAEKIRVIYPGCDHALFHVYPEAETERVLATYQLRPGYILHVGTLEPRKNIVRLIEAFEIAHRLGTDALLVLVGPPGWLHRPIFHRLERSPLRDKIVIVGAVPEDVLPSFYNGARVFVYPSLYEGFGLPVVEAMACGVPVITSATSSLPEAVGTAGILVPPDQPEEIGRAIHQLYHDDVEWERRRASGIIQSHRFSWEKMAEEVLALYEETVSGGISKRGA